MYSGKRPGRASVASMPVRPSRHSTVNSSSGVNNFISERLGEVATTQPNVSVALRDKDKQQLSQNERRSVCKSLNDMCNDSSDPDSHPGTPDAKGASSNLFSLFTKRFSDSATVQCDRLNHRPKTEAVEEEKDKPTSEQRKKLLVAALLLETEEDSKPAPKTSIKHVASPTLPKKTGKKAGKGLKKKGSFKRNSKRVNEEAVTADNQVRISESLRKAPGRPSLSKSKKIAPAPNCSKIVSFVHEEPPVSEGEEEEGEEEEEEKEASLSFKTLSQTVKTMVNVRRGSSAKNSEAS